MNLSKEGLRILKELDVDASLKVVAHRGFIPDNKEIALAGLHKARLMVSSPTFTEEELQTSRDWLLEKGYS